MVLITSFCTNETANVKVNLFILTWSHSQPEVRNIKKTLSASQIQHIVENCKDKMKVAAYIVNYCYYNAFLYFFNKFNKYTQQGNLVYKIQLNSMFILM